MENCFCRSGEIVDRTGRLVKPYPEVPQILERLKSEGYIISVASRYVFGQLMAKPSFRIICVCLLLSNCIKYGGNQFYFVTYCVVIKCC